MMHVVCGAVSWLFVVNLGIALGAGLYESRISVRRWVTFEPAAGYRWNGSAAAEDDVGRRFWAFVTTLPLTLLVLASVPCALASAAPIREWWLAAVAFALVDRALTFGYFIPTMVRLMRGDLPADAAAAKARQWVRLGVVRLAATLVAWVAALEAFRLAAH